MTWAVDHGDCLEVLRTLPDASIDSIVTDPPAGISFMGKGWDDDKGGPTEWISWLSSVMRECLRVLKPGGHALVWAIPRTSHWTGMACELAGFEVRDRVTHLFGSGFPKSRNISKDIDATMGHERAVVGMIKAPGVAITNVEQGAQGRTVTEFVKLSDEPGTPQAQQWDGWGTALKPAAEDWWLLRKPLAGTVAKNVLEHGTGAINVDGCRVGTGEPRLTQAPASQSGFVDVGSGGSHGAGTIETTAGRWPANVVLSHSDECREVGTREIVSHAGHGGSEFKGYSGGLRGLTVPAEATAERVEGTKYMQRETIPAFECAADCPVAMLDAQSGTLKSGNLLPGHKRGSGTTSYDGGGGTIAKAYGGDSGGASRFFYTAKTSTREREAGLDALPKRGAAELTDREPDTDGLKSPRAGAGRTSKGRANHHPTVKPLALMRYLVRLITPPGGVVLDPFTGSGSTGCAAVQEGMVFVGIEQDADYVEIARARIAHWEGKAA